MDRGEKAAGLFLEGYNCAQAVAVAFSDVTGLSPELSAKMASSFGGGLGRLREVCGAVSGMALVAGILYGYAGSETGGEKMAHYQRIQEMAGKFREANGSIVCREILENPSTDPAPSPRTAEYYAQRPCARMVYTAAKILEEYIEANQVSISY